MEHGPDARLTFREAGAADVPRIVELVDTAYRGETSRRGWTHEADMLEGSRTDPDAVAAIVGDPASLLLVAEAVDASGAAELVGCCQLEIRGGHAYFGMFAIRPERQAAGLGRAVLAEAERRAAAAGGVRHMRMTVLTAREELIAYYVRRGYRRTGELSPFPYGDERFGIPRRADLQFELLVKDIERN